jgi:hypothetical protein
MYKVFCNSLNYNIYDQILPIKSDKSNQKYYIITNENIKVYFGQASAFDFTIHKDEARMPRYINRHKKTKFKYWNKSGIDTPSFWSSFCYGIYQQYLQVIKIYIKN